jgi:hypothetical protein
MYRPDDPTNCGNNTTSAVPDAEQYIPGIHFHFRRRSDKVEVNLERWMKSSFTSSNRNSAVLADDVLTAIFQRYRSWMSRLRKQKKPVSLIGADLSC